MILLYCRVSLNNNPLNIFAFLRKRVSCSIKSNRLIPQSIEFIKVNVVCFSVYIQLYIYRYSFLQRKLILSNEINETRASSINVPPEVSSGLKSIKL